MKKLLCIILILGVGLSMMVSCGRDGNFVPMNKGYYKVWQALDDDVLHDTYAEIDPNNPSVSTGGYEENGLWVTNWIYSKQRSTISCEVDSISLKPGYYRFDAEFMINNISSSQLDGANYDIIAEMRVQDSETGENIAFRSINRYEFKQADVLETRSLCFAVDKNTKVDIFLCAKRNGAVLTATNRLILQAIDEEDFLVEDYSAILSKHTSLNQYYSDALYYFDLYTYLRNIPDTRVQYDLCSVIFTIQGLLNRTGEHLFIRFLQPSSYHENTDDYWFEELTKEGGEWETKTVIELNSFKEIMDLFGFVTEGLAVWDDSVPATYNVAMTACGVENLIPVRYDSNPNSFMNLLIEEYGMEVKLDLYGKFTGRGRIYGTDRASTGSAKCDAYIFAKERYLDTGLTNPTLMAYHLDAYSFDFMWKKGEQVVMYDDIQQVFLPNKDYYVMNKAFFFDLNVYENTIPLDDPNQKPGTDYYTLLEILESQNRNAGDSMIAIGGFIAWYVPKYTDAYAVDTSMPGAVAAEWRSIDVFGWYNCYYHADAYGTTGAGPLANASMYCQIPQLESYTQPGDKTVQYSSEYAELENVNYVLFYMGDYDSAAWANTAMINTYFNDPNRGALPLAWPIITNLADRVPHVINRMYQEATSNDYFVGGDNGFGYIHPSSFVDPNRPEGLNGNLDTFYEKTLYEWTKFDIDLMGFFISTTYATQDVLNVMAKLAPYGVVSNYERDPSVSVPGLIDYMNTPDILDDDVPFISLKGLSNQEYTDDQIYASLVSQLSTPEAPTFTCFRSILATPTQILNAVNRAAAQNSNLKIKVVDPYTFMKLLKESQIKTR
ncbi:MAG: hypothetical protein ACI4S9_08540 [Christensenellales bacterium]